MKIKLLSAYSRILSFVLVFLGFQSCSTVDPKDEYGAPSAKFIVKGKVENGDKEVSGLKVALGVVDYYSSNSKKAYYVDSVNTDAKGLFRVSIQDFPTSQKFVIKYEDIDGEKNGLLETVIDTVRFDNPSFTNGSGGWYVGETTKDLGTVKLNSSNPEK